MIQMRLCHAAVRINMKWNAVLPLHETHTQIHQKSKLPYPAAAVKTYIVQCPRQRVPSRSKRMGEEKGILRNWVNQYVRSAIFS